MDHTEIIGTLNEIIEYFQGCATNTAPISTGRRRFRRYIAALQECIVDQAAAQLYEEEDEPPERRDVIAAGR